MKSHIKNSYHISARSLLAFSLNEVYYWEPFWKILVEEKKLAHVIIELPKKNSYSTLFKTQITHAQNNYCKKIYLATNLFKKYYCTFILIFKHRKRNVLITQYISFFNWYCLILARVFSCKVLFKGESILLPKEKVNFLKSIYLKCFFLFCHQIFYSCKANRRLFQKIAPKRSFKPLLCFCDVIPKENIKYMNQYFHSNKLNLVLCGAFYKLKNFDIIVKVLSNYPNLKSKLRVHLIGSGETLPSILQNLRKLNVDTINHGYQPPKE